MKIEIQTAIDALYDGVYEVHRHSSKIEYDGVIYTYHSSGLCRLVYVDPDRKFVLKIPIIENELIGELEKEWPYLHWSIKHNVLEALVYEQCPDDLKEYFAETELLPNCWVKQEFVEVHPIYTGRHQFREYGKRKDGSVCLFDYDPLISNDDELDDVWDRSSYLRVINILKPI